MNTGLQLNEGEKLNLECRPLGSLVYHSMFRYSWRIAILVVFYICLLFPETQLTAHMTAGQIADAESTHKLLVIIVMIFFLYLGLLYIISSITIPQFRYIFTDQRCIIYSGFVSVTKRVIPYNRIVVVDIQQSTIQALLGLSTIFVDEKVMNSYDWARIRGLSMNDAEKISKIISQHITQQQN